MTEANSVQNILVLKAGGKKRLMKEERYGGEKCCHVATFTTFVSGKYF